MNITYSQINDQQTFEEFKSLLRTAKLPADDLDLSKSFLVAGYENNRLVVTGGLENYGQSMLLRSIAVKPELRGQLLGSQMTRYLIDYARAQRVQSVYLLTETAQKFFESNGFVTLSRDQVSDEIKQSTEFSHVCPTSAVVMRLDIQS